MCSSDLNANILVVTGTGANITGTLSVSGNANVNNIGATLHVGNLSGAGNSNVGNIGGTGAFFTTLSATANANVGNLGTGGLITATGNITGANLFTGGQVSATGNVIGSYILGNGSLLTGIVPSSLANGNSNVSIPEIGRAHV